MPRQARLDLPGYLYHVIARGLDRRPIFTDSVDRVDFLSRIEKANEHVPVQILAWALMTNHFHFLIRPGAQGLAPFMRRLMTGYAVAFNRRHKRFGYLFQNRFKSILCEEGPYFLELVRYIHLNPVRAGLVTDIDALANYRWCGHGPLLGSKGPAWQNTREVLNLFSSDPVQARRQYGSFLRDGLKEKPREDLLGGGLRRSMGGWIDRRDRQAYDAQVLGSGSFVEEVLNRVEKNHKERQTWKQVPYEALVQAVARRFGIQANGLFERGRQKSLSQAKSVLIYAGIEKRGETQKHMADLMHFSPSAIGRARLRGQALWKTLGLEAEFEKVN